MSGIFINSDSWNFWTHKDPAEMSVDGIKHDVDHYLKCGGVEAIFYNLNFQRVFFPSDRFTPIWKDVTFDAKGDLYLRGKRSDSGFKSMICNAKKMNDEVPDFIRIRYEYCHRNGVEMWHSMRMNDVHHTAIGGEELPQHSDLWVERKDLIRAWYRHFRRSIWHDNCLDYGQKEVYDYHLGMAAEYLLRFESDGIELDFLRACPVFKPGFDETHKGILTQFVRDVRSLADQAQDKWGHRIRMAVRVPYSVKDTMAAGMEVVTWCQEHLVDVVIPSPTHHATEDDVPVELWKMLLGNEALLAPCIDCTYTAQGKVLTKPQFLHSTQESANGFAASFYYQGADRIYFYNHFPTNGGFDGNLALQQELFGYAGNRKEVERRARRHVVTRHESINFEGIYPYDRFPPIIWPHCCNGTIRLNIGSIGKNSRSARAVIGSYEELKVDLLINTFPCPSLPAHAPKPKLPSEGNYFQFEIPPGTLHDGVNVLELINQGKNDITQLFWAEIDLDAE